MTTPATPFSGRTAWARNLEAPLRDFLRTETGSAAILLGATLAALVWVNINASSYDHVWHTVLTIKIGSAGISQNLREWLNSGLMTFFFFVVGLEARREFDLGELRDRRRLILPVAAGLGGMIVPIAIYLIVNAGRSSAHGWGTAMSTDTAFALGMLALVGRRFPDSLRAFILTVAVVDDLVALVVIGTAYSSHVMLIAAAGRDRRVRRNAGRSQPQGPQRRCLLRPRPGGVGRAAEVRRRPGRGRAGVRAGDDRLPGVARRPRARHRPVPHVPRAADIGARPVSPRRGALRDLPQRALSAALPPVHQLRDRAAVRAGQRGHRDQRLVPVQGLHVADHARDHRRLRARKADRDRRHLPGS